MGSDLSRDDTTEETVSGLTGRIARWRTNPLDPEQSGTIEYSLYETRAAAADMTIFALVGITVTGREGRRLTSQELRAYHLVEIITINTRLVVVPGACHPLIGPSPSRWARYA